MFAVLSNIPIPQDVDIEIVFGFDAKCRIMDKMSPGLLNGIRKLKPNYNSLKK